MRYHPDHKRKTRQRLLKDAARRYRAEGLNGVGIANLMADLGLTHGGFYAHFTDKEALVTAACAEAFGEQQRHWDRLVEGKAQDEARARVIGDYLSRHHRDHPETGCFAAALAGEMARRDTRSRRAFTDGIRQMIDRLAQLAGSGKPPACGAEASLALLVGSVVLARAVSDPDLSDRMLAAARAVLLAGDDA